MAWAKHGFSNTDILFGHAKARLDKVSVEDWLMLLMRIMIMEYNQLLFPGRFRLQWGMREALTALGLGFGFGLGLGLALTLPKPDHNPNQALTALRSLELTPPPSKSNPTDFNAFHHSFYLATHIVYVQSAYNAIKADQVRVRVRD